jgi:hypothetical protein
VSKKDEGLFQRAQDKPCAWCGETKGFQLGLTNKQILSLQVMGTVQGAAAVFVDPKNFIKTWFSTKGIIIYCKACSGRVAICPECDTPNRDEWFISTCKNCGAKFGC